MKTFGKVEFDVKDRAWVITPQPHVMIRMKRVFERIPKHAHGSARLSDTPENARELQWFLERFPMEISDQARTRLDNTAQQHEERENDIARMLSVDYQPRAFKLALPLRPYQQLAADLALASKQLLLADDVGLGKAQPDDEPVLTPGGWVRMDALRIGDDIIDPDGGWAKVTGVYPQGQRDIYEIKTSDGGSTRCCAEHLWTVQTPADRRQSVTRTISTMDLRALVRAKARRPRGYREGTFLPLPSPVTFACPSSRLPLNPYLLGVLLGDGVTASGPLDIFKPDHDLHKHVRAALPQGSLLVPTTRKHRTRIVGMDGTRRSSVRTALEGMCLVGCRAWEKHVPINYLRANIQDRWALLRGLMDTDGECEKSAHCIFTTTSPHLRDAVLELVRSLGGIARACYRAKPTYRYKGVKRIGRPAWRVRINVPECPFTIERKAKWWHKTQASRKVVGVERVGKGGVRCIRVSSKRSLYLTKDYITTHNTASMIATLSDPSTRPALIVTMTHLPQQFADEIDRFLPGLRIHILRGAQPYDVTDVWSGRKRKDREKAMPDVIITSYSRISGWADTLAPMIKSLYFDEVHELRHGGTNKYIAASHLREKAQMCVGASATPVNGYGGELWYVMNIVAPGMLGTRPEFLREHCGKEDITNDEDMAELKASGGDKKAQLADPAAFGAYLMSSGLMLRRTRKEVGRELPPVQRIPYVIDADPDEMRDVQIAAADLAKIILSQKSDVASRFNAGGRLDALIRQATGVAKAPYVAEFARMLLEQGEKVVLFGWHKQVYEIWREKLAEFKPAWYTGEEDTKEKHESKRRFCEGETNLLILSLRSGAGLDGLQYTGCRIVIFGELDWSEAQHEQAEGRVARDGQDESVACYYLLCNAGSDPVIVDVLGLKRRQLEGIRNPNAPKLALKQTAADDRAKRLAAALLSKLDPDAYKELTGKDAIGPVTTTSADFTSLVEANARVDGEGTSTAKPVPLPRSPLPSSPSPARTAASSTPTTKQTPPTTAPAPKSTDPRKPGPVTHPPLPHTQLAKLTTPPALPMRPPVAVRVQVVAPPKASPPSMAKPAAAPPAPNMGAWADRLGGVVRGKR